ncbi:hypothetical protein BH24ACT22_BH24ACT22_10380 [soil metagenome]
MDLTLIFFVVVALVVVSGGVWLLVGGFGKPNHQLTGPELRNRALKESERLAELVGEREAQRPSDEHTAGDYQSAVRRFTPHDEETLNIYYAEHLPKIADLREHFAARRIRNHMLDDLYSGAEDEADLRTISTALQEMAGRI